MVPVMGTRRLHSQFLRSAQQQFVALCDRAITHLTQQRRVQLAVVAMVSLIVGAMTYSMNSSAATARAQWTSRVKVLVTTTAVKKGDSFTEQNTRVVDLPEAVIADDALVSLPRGARARVSVAANTALTASLIDDDNSTAPIPRGWRGVAMPSDLIAPQLTVGDTVDVIASNQVICRSAIVVEHNAARGITIAVPAVDAPAVASASQMGDVSLIVAQ